jgi:hypothetical protein
MKRVSEREREMESKKRPINNTRIFKLSIIISQLNAHNFDGKEIT